MQLTADDLARVMTERQLNTLDSVMEVTGAGTVCGSCIEDLQLFINQLNNSGDDTDNESE